MRTTQDSPLDFEATLGRSLIELWERFDVREVRFDPWQLMAVGQRLTAAGCGWPNFLNQCRT